MQTKFSKEFMVNNCGCYSEEELNRCSFMSREEIEAIDILNSEIPFKDKIWFFVRKVFSKEQNQQFAILYAKSVLHIHENEYPEDLRPRRAVEKAELYLKGECSLEELKDAVAAAAHAADAAFDAAYASYAADAAADAAAHAASYASYASYAARAASYNAACAASYVYEVDLLKIFKDFIHEIN